MTGKRQGISEASKVVWDRWEAAKARVAEIDCQRADAVSEEKAVFDELRRLGREEGWHV